MAELFHSDIPASTAPIPDTVPDKLPGISNLDSLARVSLLLTEVDVGVHRVCGFDDDGFGVPDLSPLRAMLDAPSRRPDDVRLEILSVHCDLLAHLTAADFRLGKAYGLGRALGETTMLPSAKVRQSFTQPFDPYRMATLETWLSDLKSLLPDHASEGVRGSLRTWASWVANPMMEVWSEKGRHVVDDRAVDWASTDDQVRINGALGRQGQVWRAMLSGEKQGTDLLSTEHYVKAGDQLVDRLGDLLRQYLWRYKWVLLVAVVIVAAVVALVSALSLSSALAAGAATAVGAIGISWKGVGGTLGKALSMAERPLWDAALDASIVIAATRLPQEVRPD